MLKLYGKKNKKLTVDLSTVNELKENDKILIASNGKMKQIDQELVNIGGGGNTPDGPTFDDGKTRLFVTVASIDRPVIAIYFGCTVVGGVTIDWGDGSDTEVTTSTERTRYSHSYSAAGDYIIVLEVTDGELVLEGVGNEDVGFYGIMTQNYDDSEPPYSLPYVTTALKRVEIGNGVTSIGEGAFASCSALTSIVIPEGVTSIGDNSFEYCFALTSVTIPPSVTSIGDDVFNGCSSLSSIVIPEGVTSIGDGVFNGCSSLSSIVIPEGVTSIGNNSFAYCSALISVTIPSSVTSIGTEAFFNCFALSSVTIPEGVASIGNGAFSQCYALTSVTIPEGVASIGNGAFNQCIDLTSIVIPEGVTSIGDSAFEGCISVGSYYVKTEIPPTLGNSSFSGIPSDCKIYIPAGSMEAYSTATNWSDYTSYLVEE